MNRKTQIFGMLLVLGATLAAALSVADANGPVQSLGRPAAAGQGEASEELALNERLGRLTASPLATKPGAYAASIRERAKIAASGNSISGTTGTWTPLGHGPMKGDDARFTRIANTGMGDLAGRINHFAYDPSSKTLYASVGQGGVWALANGSTTWRSIGDNLPTQAVGGIGFSPENRGTIIVLTGNDVFGGGTTFTGVGAYYSTNGGSSWTKAKGIPDGVNAFQVAVDPTNGKIVYAATGGGLFRSTDAGKTYVNVKLPVSPPGSTPNCTGALPTVEGCYLANMVTDVVVRAPGGVGLNKQGGAVVAAVGWRAGNKTNSSAHYPSYVESPGNGIYTSVNGAQGSFTKVPSPFGSTAPLGRIELGNAVGPAQDHDYLYAVVQDATGLQGGIEAGGIDVPGGTGAPSKATTYLLGVYSSADFGKTWSLMTTPAALMNPASGSSLTGLACESQNTYCPGAQAWYNQWIEPDPTRADATGVPTRLVFGLEEVWENRLADNGIGAKGLTDFKVIGSYTGGTSCFNLILNFPACPTAAGFGGTTTHPDQHDGLFVPDGNGGVTLYAGNDGGAFAQHVDAGRPLTNAGWGRGLNNGFNTLMPYQAVMAKDGIAYAGLQDNGELRTEQSGSQFNTHDGDGTWSAVDPDDSNTVYERQPGGAIQVSSDGGKNWSSAASTGDTVQFVNPFAMDPADANHFLDAGNQVWESFDAGATWDSVYTAGTSAGGATFAMSAIDVRSQRYGPPLPTGPHTPNFTYTDGAGTVPAGQSGTVDIPGTYVDHPFTIGPTEGDARVTVQITWTDATNDWDLYLYRSDNGTLTLLKSSGAFNLETGVPSELVTVGNPPAGNYVIRVVNSSATGTFTGTATFEQRTETIPSQLHNTGYAAFCGTCDALNARPFDNQIATNAGTGGWHKAAAIGLPKRFITSIVSDPSDPKIVYVTLAGYSRRWLPVGAMYEGTANVGKGHVFKSTDAGEHFTDISGNLPDGPAESTLLYNGKLIVGTDTGVYISATPGGGGKYELLGRGLPNAPVFSLGLKPKAAATDPDLLYVATHGRGIYTYRLS